MLLLNSLVGFFILSSRIHAEQTDRLFVWINLLCQIDRPTLSFPDCTCCCVYGTASVNDIVCRGDSAFDGKQGTYGMGIIACCL